MNLSFRIASTSYCLGQNDISVFDFVEGLSKFDCPDIKYALENSIDLRIYRSDDVVDMVSRSISNTLSNFNGDSKAVKLLIVYSSSFNTNFAVQNKVLLEIVKRCKWSPEKVILVSGSGCAAMFGALDVATSIMKNGSYSHALVVGWEAITSASSRLLPFAFLSDAASSFILEKFEFGEISKKHVNFATLLDFQTSIDFDQIEDGFLLTQDFSPLHRSLEVILSRNHMDLNDVEVVFSNNLISPVKSFRHARLGFSSLQEFDLCAKKIGHCLSCDPIVNLTEAFSNSLISVGDRLLLTSEASGHGGVALLQIER